MRSRGWRRDKNLSKFMSRIKKLYNSGLHWYIENKHPVRAKNWKDYMKYARYAKILKNTGTPYGKGVSVHLDNKQEDLKEKRFARKLMEEEISREENCKYCDYCPEWCENCPFRY